MASVGEALGMSLPGSASPAAVNRRRDDFAFMTRARGDDAHRTQHQGARHHDEGGVLTVVSFTCRPDFF